ncbi:MAG: hypothetical protein AABZ55_13815 [Bdellovibrionota bacterium]
MHKNFLTVLVTFAAAGMVSAVQVAQAAEIKFAVEPVVGYERVQKLKPSLHFSNRLIYGVRARAGLPLASAEAEYTRGEDTESYPILSLTTKDTDDKLKLGIRSSFRLSGLFHLWGRGGVQGKRNRHEDTQSGVTTVTVGNFVYRPYAGIGLSAGLGHNLELDGGVTVIFNDFPRMQTNEYETTLGFSVRFP